MTSCKSWQAVGGRDAGTAGDVGGIGEGRGVRGRKTKERKCEDENENIKNFRKAA